MANNFFLWAGFCSVCAAVSVMLGSTVSAGMGIEEIESKLTEQLKTVNTIFTRYHYVSEPDPESVGEISFDWALDGDMRRVCASAQHYSMSYDGEYGYVYLDVDGPRRHLDVHDNLVRGYHDQITPAFPFGLSLMECDVGIVDLIAAGKSHVIETDGGLPTVAVDAFINRNGVSRRMVASLDPAHDFLPSRIELTKGPDSKESSDWKYLWEVLEYEKVDDETLGGQRWYPKVSRLTQGSGPTIRLTIDEIKVNASLDRTLFRPKVPDGFVAGDTVGVDKVVQDLVQPANNQALRGVSRGMILVIINVAAIVALFVFLLMRRPAKP
jgi:hypothetical protein